MPRNSIFALCVGMSFLSFAYRGNSYEFSRRMEKPKPSAWIQVSSESYVIRFRIQADGDAIVPVAFAPNSEVLAVKDKPAIKLFDAKSGELKAKLMANDKWKKDNSGRVYFSSDGKTLVVPAFAVSRIRLWDMSTYRQRALLTDIDYFGFLDLSDRYVMTKSEDNRSLQFWEISSGQLAKTLSLPEPKDWVNSSSGKITTAAYSPDGEDLVVASWAKVYIYDADSFALQKTLSKKSWDASPVVDLSFSPDSRTLALKGLSPLVALQDTETYEFRTWLEGHKGNVHSVRFSPDSRWIATTSKDKTLKLWDVATGEMKITLTEPKGECRFFEFSPNNRWLATSLTNREEIDIWDVATLQLKASLPSRREAFFCFSPDGHSLAVADKNAGVTVWDISNLR
jgi:WD40 repeat protein